VYPRRKNRYLPLIKQPDSQNNYLYKCDWREGASAWSRLEYRSGQGSGVRIYKILRNSYGSHTDTATLSIIYCVVFLLLNIYDLFL